MKLKSLTCLCVFALMVSCSGNMATTVQDEKTDSGQWVELFEAESWNKFEANELAVFWGIVKYVPAKNEPNFVQRYNPYRLGELEIYCGSSDALGGYVGKEVEIKGKKVVTSLEGAEFEEIWPSMIRIITEPIE